MKKSDICVISVIYAVALFFFVMTVQLPEAAQTYPLGLIIALAVLNTLYLAQCLVKAAAAGRKGIVNDFPEIFKELLPRQFAFVLGGCVLFLVLMYTVGYYIAGALYLIGTLLYFKVPPRWIAVTLVVLVALVYFAFTKFLNVPLPAGILFS